MPLTDKSANALASNQVKVDLVVLTKAQAWAEQVRGAYYFLYPHIVADFSHRDDIQQWVDQVFAVHKHMKPGCEGGPITEPVMAPQSSSQITDIKGKALLVSNSVLGMVHKGANAVKTFIATLNKINKES